MGRTKAGLTGSTSRGICIITSHLTIIESLNPQTKSTLSPLSTLLQLLRGWSGLSRPVRARVVWVVSHYLHLPAAVDESWETLLKALSDTMARCGHRSLD